VLAVSGGGKAGWGEMEGAGTVDKHRQTQSAKSLTLCTTHIQKQSLSIHYLYTTMYKQIWPHAGAWGAEVILPPCAQLLWCELYVMKSTKQKKK